MAKLLPVGFLKLGVNKTKIMANDMLKLALLNIIKAFRHPRKASRFIIYKVKKALLWDYYYAALRKPKVKSSFSCIPQLQDEIVKELRMNDLNIFNFEIDVDDYKKYISNAKYFNYPDYYGGGRKEGAVEKFLEHYLAAKLLNISKDDVYIDIASSNSPAPEIYGKIYSCEVYRQDLAYRKGIHGNVIGGNACDMPVESGFATKMALHCSFEHFEQDSDIKFIKETSRVLRKGGKLCILPLYLSNKYIIQTDPASSPRGGISFESDAVLYCAKGWGERHGRFYDVPHFITRIKNNLNNLRLTIYVIQNEKEIDAYCYIKFIGLFERE